MSELTAILEEQIGLAMRVWRRGLPQPAMGQAGPSAALLSGRGGGVVPRAEAGSIWSCTLLQCVSRAFGERMFKFKTERFST